VGALMRLISMAWLAVAPVLLAASASPGAAMATAAATAATAAATAASAATAAASLTSAATAATAAATSVSGEESAATRAAAMGSALGAAMTAQGRLERATFRASIPADSGHAAVHITYVVASARSAGDSVPVTLLRFDGASVRNIITRVNSTAVDPTLRASDSPLRLRGLVPLGTGEPGAPLDPDPAGATHSSFVIDITYEVAIVSREPAYPIRLPILAVMWPPDPALPGTFQGEVTVPPGLRIYDPFPASLQPVAASAGSATTGDVMRYAVDLPVLPAMIAFHLAQVDQPVITMANVLDVFVLLAIAIIWTFMWRQFRREA
jgi:hypothetical protein